MVRLFLIISALWVGAAAAQCRQALILGMDVSGSVNEQEYQLQFTGLARALLSDEVRDRLLLLPEQPVVFGVFEWSGPNYQRIIIPVREIRSYADIVEIAGILTLQEKQDRPPTTGLGAAVSFGMELLMRQDCWKRVLDISGDGKNNSGPRPADIPVPSGGEDITINGLVIGTDTSDRLSHEELTISELSAYYQHNILRGAGAFLETALGFKDFERAMLRKLLRELELPNLSAL